MPLRAWMQALGYVALALLGILGTVRGLLGAAGGARWVVWPWAGALVVVLLLAGALCWLFLPGGPGCAPSRGQRGRRRIAFTFDDGPNGADTEAVLDVLARHGARATFFCVGRAAREQPHLLRRMAAAGHLVGNHTEDHRKLTWLSRDQVAYQVEAAQQAIVQSGVPAPRWFRAPHGFKSPWLPGILRRRGLRLCAWSHGVWDSDCPGAEVIVRRARRWLRDGEILLLHDGGGERGQTAVALDALLSECRRRGLQPVTLAEILDGPGLRGLTS